jgi:hypothetical protein
VHGVALEQLPGVIWDVSSDWDYSAWTNLTATHRVLVGTVLYNFIGSNIWSSVCHMGRRWIDMVGPSQLT